MLLNVLDFTDPAAALAIADHGDRVYFPGTREYEAPLGGWQVNKGIEIFGDGPGTPGNRRGSILTPSSVSGSANDVFVCNAIAPIGVPNIFIHDLWITRRTNGPVVDGRHGIVYEPGASNVQLSEAIFRRLRIDALGGSAIRLFGFPGTYGAVNNVLIEDCLLGNCAQHGLILNYGVGVLIKGTRMAFNGREGCFIANSESALFGCSFESNRQGSSVQTTPPSESADLVVQDGIAVRIDGCEFQQFKPGPQQQSQLSRGCCLRGVRAGHVSGCDFALSVSTADAVGIDIRPSGPIIGQESAAVAVFGNRFDNIGNLVVVDGSTKGATILPQFSTSAMGAIIAPSPAALIAGSIARGASNDLAGLVVPQLASPPGFGDKVGMLAYFSDATPGLRVRTPTGWKQLRVDTEPPPAISDLAIPQKGPHSLRLQWIAPHDPLSGPYAAAEYDLRYSLTQITSSNFAAATRLATNHPLLPGAAECIVLTGLTETTNYYSAIKFKDRFGNWSTISNVVSATTLAYGTGPEAWCP